jgi:hypothetical protein
MPDMVSGKAIDERKLPGGFEKEVGPLDNGKKEHMSAALLGDCRHHTEDRWQGKSDGGREAQKSHNAGEVARACVFACK